MTISTTAIVLIVFSFLLFLIAFYPFGPYQLSLMLLRRWKAKPFRPAASGAEDLSFAILLCAYNEEAVIRQKVENMLAMRGDGQLDILIYVDKASDRTADIIREFGSAVTLVDSTERHGKPWGMNKLVSMTDADIVLFTDANVMVEPDCVDLLRPYFADPDVGCVTSHLVYTNADETATSQVGAAYWRLDDWTKSLETETGSAMGADGSLFAIRRDLHQPSPDHLIDDLYVSMSVLCQGARLVRGADIMAYEPHTTTAKDEFGRKVRIACQCIGVHRTLLPRLRSLSRFDRYKWVAHRLLRWVGGYFLAASAILFALAVLAQFGPWAALGTVAAVALVFAAGTALGVGPVLQINNMIVAFAGNARGVARAFVGQPVVTWDVADSARQDGSLATPNEGRPG